MFILIIWLQGIWLPQHGYDFARTPLWAGLAMVPLTAGFLIGGPVSGVLSDRYGARPFATGGLLGSAAGFLVLELLPINFSYPVFAVVLFVMGLLMAGFGSPNRAAVMNALPARHRGAGSGMNTTFQNSAQVLSIGLFFTLMIVGLSATLPAGIESGLTAHGVPRPVADHVAHLPPVSTLFAAFLGYNPMEHLLGPHALAQLPPHQRAVITSREYFPHLISGPFRNGLHTALNFAIGGSILGAAMSWVRGGKYHYTEPDEVVAVSDPQAVGA
jgi:MFS family permease